jgi:hypothetical protein
MDPFIRAGSRDGQFIHRRARPSRGAPNKDRPEGPSRGTVPRVDKGPHRTAVICRRSPPRPHSRGAASKGRQRGTKGEPKGRRREGPREGPSRGSVKKGSPSAPGGCKGQGFVRLRTEKPSRGAVSERPGPSRGTFTRDPRESDALIPLPPPRSGSATFERGPREGTSQ